MNRIALACALALMAGCASSPDTIPPAAPAPDCSDGARFERALAGEPVPAACSVLAPDEAYGLGEMIRERRAIIQRIRTRLENGPPDSRPEAVRLRQQLIRAERELPELEALARFEGWLPPAPLPEG